MSHLIETRPCVNVSQILVLWCYISLSLTVNMLFSPPPALVAIRVSTPISFITLTGMAVCNN